MTLIASLEEDLVCSCPYFDSVVAEPCRQSLSSRSGVVADLGQFSTVRVADGLDQSQTPVRLMDPDIRCTGGRDDTAKSSSD